MYGCACQVTAICPGVKTLRVETRGCFDIVLDSHGRASFYLRFLVDGDSQVECGNSDDREGAEWHGAGGEAASASVCVGLREGHTVTSRGVVPVASLPIRLLQEVRRYEVDCRQANCLPEFVARHAGLLLFPLSPFAACAGKCCIVDL